MSVFLYLHQVAAVAMLMQAAHKAGNGANTGLHQYGVAAFPIHALLRFFVDAVFFGRVGEEAIGTNIVYHNAVVLYAQNGIGRVGRKRVVVYVKVKPGSANFNRQH